jgi:hypothetical protein
MHADFLVTDARVPVSISASPSPGKRYYLADWLGLHGLTASQCEQGLARIQHLQAAGRTDAAGAPCDLTGEEAWQVAAGALRAALPAGAAAIEAVRTGAVRAFRPRGARGRRAFTFAGPHPVVSLDYDGRVADLLTVAHELGHAVQIAAVGGFVPPVARELCAFLAELALLDHLRVESPALNPLALAAWGAATRHYVREGKTLAAALQDPRSVYHYGWNYPIARVLASECHEQLPPSALWSIFENRTRLSGILTFLACERHGSPACSGACLAVAGDMT